MPTDNFEEYSINTRIECDNYDATVYAILAFSSHIINNSPDNNNSDFGIGRKMMTSDNNVIRKNTQITPDLVVQKNDQYGIVTEVKSTLCNDESFWNQHIDQLKKYNDDLTGWWTENELIDLSDTVLLLHYSKTRPFLRYIQTLQASGIVLDDTKIAIIEFSRDDRSQTYIRLRLEWGSLNDSAIKNQLDNSIGIPLADILREFSSLKYYDSEPPEVKLLADLWTDNFLSETINVDYDEKNKCFPIKVSISSITEELQKAYGFKSIKHDGNSVEFPRKKWISRALKTLEKMKLAERIRDDEYMVFYKRFSQGGDVLDKFIELNYKLKNKENTISDRSQVGLFPGKD